MWIVVASVVNSGLRLNMYQSQAVYKDAAQVCISTL